MTQPHDPDAIWSETADGGRFLCRVTRLDARNGHFTVTAVRETPPVVLLDKEVPLYFGAPFGPDVSDVQIWTHDALGAIDRWLEARGETPPDA